MTTELWGKGTFHEWLLAKINEAVDEGREIVVRKFSRDVETSDFGYTSERLDKWITDAPKDLPDGKKMMDIVGSRGFLCLDSVAQRILIQVWIQRELLGQNAAPSDEIGHFVGALVEMSEVDFLLKCLKQSKA